jgi:hypothetical protein
VSAAITAAAVTHGSNPQFMRLLPTLHAAQSPAALRKAIADAKALATRQLGATLDRLQEEREEETNATPHKRSSTPNRRRRHDAADEATLAITLPGSRSPGSPPVAAVGPPPRWALNDQPVCFPLLAFRSACNMWPERCPVRPCACRTCVQTSRVHLV